MSPNSLPTLRMHSRTGFKRCGEISTLVVAGGERAHLVWVDDDVVPDAGLYDGKLFSDSHSSRSVAVLGVYLDELSLSSTRLGSVYHKAKVGRLPSTHPVGHGQASNVHPFRTRGRETPTSHESQIGTRPRALRCYGGLAMASFSLRIHIQAVRQVTLPC